MATTNDKRLRTIAKASRKLLPLVSSVIRQDVSDKAQLYLALDALFDLAETMPQPFNLLIGYKHWLPRINREDLNGLIASVRKD